MRFYGNGVVWDGENNKRLCKFVGGVCDTDDARIIERLIKAGYKHEADNDEPNDPHYVGRFVCNECGHEWVGVAPEGTPVESLECAKCHAQNARVRTESDDKDEHPVTADLGVKKLREIGKELGLSFPASTTKVEMAAKINEAAK